ncbi:hypothetical protein CVD28_20430 [Bacillus sp. M6-12]|uniref:nuclease-related domain-containing protein n=1 Tax=Bacillus sp. M6-12 TaxID=2054166 RepID=UPI000C777BCA|nr:nuclease-related domain-containing protein [Bacillus sp. M6-12]PLS15870.1 hypothetical protein CVD28_20430 [Bacillus sp. M6-12]
MIVKERRVPLRILMNEALLRRLPKNHLQLPAIEADLLKRNAGYRGEQTIDFELNLLLENNFLIFHDLRLPSGKYYVQLDTLIISPYFALIIEVKNISGTLLFERHFQQLIRTINGKEEGFPDPLSQVNKQRLQLRNWFKCHRMPDLPVECLIVISNPSTILQTNREHSDFSQKVCHATHLAARIEKLSNLHTNQKLTTKQLQKVKKTYYG